MYSYDVIFAKRKVSTYRKISAERGISKGSKHYAK